MALAAVGDLENDRQLVLFELQVDDVVATTYLGEETERRRWRAGQVD